MFNELAKVAVGLTTVLTRASHAKLQFSSVSVICDSSYLLKYLHDNSDNNNNNYGSNIPKDMTSASDSTVCFLYQIMLTISPLCKATKVHYFFVKREFFFHRVTITRFLKL